MKWLNMRCIFVDMTGAFHHAMRCQSLQFSTNHKYTAHTARNTLQTCGPAYAWTRLHLNIYLGAHYLHRTNPLITKRKAIFCSSSPRGPAAAANRDSIYILRSFSLGHAFCVPAQKQAGKPNRAGNWKNNYVQH